ncbi:S8 family serine peptidase [Bacillus velezensis]|nr:S8 family serine peptidase [Bacillus velezensis]
MTSTYLNQMYATADGTSQAAPHVTGMFAPPGRNIPRKQIHSSGEQMRQKTSKIWALPDVTADSGTAWCNIM